MALKTLIVPEKLKEELRKPFGKVFSSILELKIPENAKLMTVGDVCSYNAIKHNFNPSMIVYDGMEGRKNAKKEISDVLESYEAKKVVVKNPAGYITKELWSIVKKYSSVNFRVKIFVDGEEDLSVIPLVLESENGSALLYGLMNKGVVFVEIDENIKNKCKELLSYMKGL